MISHDLNFKYFFYFLDFFPRSLNQKLAFRTLLHAQTHTYTLTLPQWACSFLSSWLLITFFPPEKLFWNSSQSLLSLLSVPKSSVGHLSCHFLQKSLALWSTLPCLLLSTVYNICKIWAHSPHSSPWWCGWSTFIKPCTKSSEVGTLCFLNFNYSV